MRKLFSSCGLEDIIKSDLNHKVYSDMGRRLNDAELFKISKDIISLWYTSRLSRLSSLILKTGRSRC
jgi:hypothetical protein